MPHVHDLGKACLEGSCPDNRKHNEFAKKYKSAMPKPGFGRDAGGSMETRNTKDKIMSGEQLSKEEYDTIAKDPELRNTLYKYRRKD